MRYYWINSNLEYFNDIYSHLQLVGGKVVGGCNFGNVLSDQDYNEEATDALGNIVSNGSRNQILK